MLRLFATAVVMLAALAACADPDVSDSRPRGDGQDGLLGSPGSQSTTSPAPSPSASADPDPDAVPDPATTDLVTLAASPAVTEALAIARRQAHDLLTFTPDTVPQTLERLRGRSTEAFQKELETSARSLIEAIADEGLSSKGTVNSVGLAALDPDSATVLVSATSTVTQGGGGPQSLELGLVRQDSAWLVDSLDVVSPDAAPAPSGLLDDLGLGEVPDHVARVLSYTPASVTSDLAAERRLLTEDFGDEYDSLVRRTIAPLAKRQRVSTDATVSAAGLVAADTSGRATLLLFTTSENTSGQKASAPTEARIAVPVELEDGDWLIDDLRTE